MYKESIENTYEHRDGAQFTEYGKDYEKWIITYFSIVSCLNKYKDFWILSNADGLGVFDDVVLYVKKEDTKEFIVFCQLKHKEESLKPVEIDVKSFENDYLEIKNLLLNSETKYPLLRKLLLNTKVPFENMYFLVLTNSKIITKKRHKKLQLKPAINENISFINTSKHSNYLYTLENYDSNSDFNKQFYFFLNQAGVKENEIKDIIFIKLNKYFKIPLENLKILVDQFYNRVIEWFTDKKGILTKCILAHLLKSQLLSHVQFNMNSHSQFSSMSDNNLAIWKKATEHFRVVMLSNVNLLANNQQEKLNTPIVLYSRNNKSTITSLLAFFQDLNLIIIISNSEIESLKLVLDKENVSYLSSAVDLLLDCYMEIETLPLKLHGKNNCLKTLRCNNPGIIDLISTDNILQILNENFNIVDSVTLPKYFVTRSFERIILKTSIFSLNNSYFIIIDENSLIDMFFEQNPKVELKINNCFMCSNYDFDVNIYLNKKANLHIFRLIQISSIIFVEWIYSKCNNIFEIENNINQTVKVVLSMDDFIHRLNLNFYNIAIIGCNPGMGKTYFLKHLYNTIPNKFWPIFVTLNEINLKHIKNIDTFIYDYKLQLNMLESAIFQEYLFNKSIIIFFDGFDEIEKEDIINALHLINQGLIEKEWKIIVTTRNVTKDELEKSLKILPLSLLPFNEKDKIEFLDNYYLDIVENANLKIVENVDKFSKQLLKKLSCSAWDEEFSGIPLQCRMLSESFVNEFLIFAQTGVIKLPEDLTTIKLYEKFIDTKFEILFKDKLKIDSSTIVKKKLKEITENEHMIAAVQIIFPEGKVKISNDFIKKILTAEDKIGLICGIDKNKKAIFVHRTIAEFFTAKWFVENGIKKRSFKLSFESQQTGYNVKLLYQPKYEYIRDIYDRYLCKSHPLHSAVLNLDIIKVKEILRENKEESECSCSRTVFHLIASRGAEHKNRNGEEIERIGEDKYLNMLKLFLMNGIWVDKKDDLLGWTPSEYAINRNAVGVMDALLEHGFGNELEIRQSSFRKLMNVITNAIATPQKLTKWKLEDVLKMCAKYDYPSIAKNCTDLNKLPDVFKTQLLQSCAKYDASKFGLLLLNQPNCVTDLKEMNILLFTATFYNSFLFIETLFKIKNDKGQTILHRAVVEGLHEILDILMLKVPKRIINSVINITDENGRTAFHTAGLWNNTYALNLLLNKEIVATADLKDNQNKTALNISREYENNEAFFKLFHFTEAKNSGDIALYENIRKEEHIWKHTNPLNPIPQNAFIAASSDAEILYIGRGYFKGGLYPVKISPIVKEAFVIYDNALKGWEEHNIWDCEILCGNNFEWVEVRHGKLPNNAVRGGKHCLILHIGRIIHLEKQMIGAVYDGKLYISYKKEILNYYEKYEVLVWK